MLTIHFGIRIHISKYQIQFECHIWLICITIIILMLMYKIGFGIIRLGIFIYNVHQSDKDEKHKSSETDSKANNPEISKANDDSRCNIVCDFEVFKDSLKKKGVLHLSDKTHVSDKEMECKTYFVAKTVHGQCSVNGRDNSVVEKSSYFSWYFINVFLLPKSDCCRTRQNMVNMESFKVLKVMYTRLVKIKLFQIKINDNEICF